MIAQQTQDQAGLAVRKSLVVKASPERAFSVFTEGLSTWWPLDTHHIGSVTAVAGTIEPREGGRCYERGADGSESIWGHVLVWDPPTRFAMTWELSCDFSYDPDMASEVEVRFIPEGDGTRVELVHRGLEVYGDKSTQMYGVFDSEGGWTGLLERFRKAAES